MFKGKHSKENLYVKQLEETIDLKDREIADIKNSLADAFQEILVVNESNSYNNKEIKQRKISEICRDKIYELRKDLFIENDSKIIELPTRKVK